MALKKNAHQLFTDREEPRQAFWNTLRELEENPRSTKVITYYGEGGIGKSWLLNDLKRRVERMDPDDDQSHFDDGFVFRGEYVPVFYNLETSIDQMEILCQLRYSLYMAKQDLAFPLFDCAVKKYKDITGKNLVSADSSSDSFLSRYEKYLDTAAMFIPGLGTLQSVYSSVRNGGSAMRYVLDKIQNKKLRSLYSEYFDAISSSETADDIRDNIAEFFKTDLNISEREYSIIFFIDTYELLTYSSGISSQRWLCDELAKETENTLWVFAGRNKIYSNFENEHLLGDLSRDDTVHYLKDKIGISDDAVVERIYEITHGTPIFLDICVQNYRSEGNPSAEEFQNLNKEQLLKRYVKYLSDAERLVIRLMSSMSHWTDEDYQTVFNAVHNGSFSQYNEAYNKIIRSTMIEKDNEDRYFLHRAVRTGIYEDPDYPALVRNSSREEILNLYQQKAEDGRNPLYYTERLIEIISGIVAEKQPLDSRQMKSLSYALINENACLFANGKKNTLALYSSLKDILPKIQTDETGKAYADLCLANVAVQANDYSSAYEICSTLVLQCEKLFGYGSKNTISAKRCLAVAMLNHGEYDGIPALLEPYMEDPSLIDDEKSVEGEAPTTGIPETLSAVYQIMNKPEKALPYARKEMEEAIQRYGENSIGCCSSYLAYSGLLNQIGNYEEAAEILKKAYEIARKRMGESHELTLLALNNYAISLFQCGNIDKSVSLLEEAYPSTVSELGENDKTTLLMAANLGYFMSNAGRAQEGLPLLEQCLKGFRNNGSEKVNQNITRITMNTGSACFNLGRYEYALQYYEQALQAAETVLGKEHPDTLLIESLMGRCLLSMGDTEKALSLCHDSWQKLKEYTGEATVYSYSAALNLADVYAQMAEPPADYELVFVHVIEYCSDTDEGKETEDKYYKMLLDISERKKAAEKAALDNTVSPLEKRYEELKNTLGENACETISAKQEIMKALFEAKHYAESLQLAQQTFDIAKDTLGEDDSVTLLSLYYVQLNQRSLCRFEEAIETAKQIMEFRNDNIII